MNQKYKHLFFDLDRTLWDFDANSKLALEELYSTYNLEARTTKSFDKFYKTYKSTNAFYWAQYQQGNIKKESLRSIRFIKTLESLSLRDVQTGMSMGEDYIKISPFKTQLFPNTIDVLSSLKNRGHRMHIITNGFSEVQHIKLEKSGLSSFFEEIIISDEFGKNKPHPSIFHHAMERSNAEHHESLMIGDSIQADLIGAQGVDMDQVYFNPTNIQHDHKFTYEIQDLKELLSL